ncbi:hypothetical protein ACJX0J_036559 [Zea mays]
MTSLQSMLSMLKKAQTAAAAGVTAGAQALAKNNASSVDLGMGSSVHLNSSFTSYTKTFDGIDVAGRRSSDNCAYGNSALIQNRDILKKKRRTYWDLIIEKNLIKVARSPNRENTEDLIQILLNPFYLQSLLDQK